jgi:hypothetical protein
MGAAASRKRKQVVVTPDGWVTESLRTFRILVDHSPPRPWGYRDTLREDVRQRRFHLIWLASLGFIALGVTTGWWLVGVLVGGYFLVRLALLVRSTVHSLRNSPLAVGVLLTPKVPHSLLIDVMLGRVRLADGREASVAFPGPLASALPEGQDQVEVMFLDRPEQRYSVVLAFRSIPHQDDPE